jgi:hypothetical protein
MIICHIINYKTTLKKKAKPEADLEAYRSAYFLLEAEATEAEAFRVEAEAPKI